MARTFRSNSSSSDQRDGVRQQRFLKLNDRYTGWVGEDVVNPKTKKLLKKHANKHNRQLDTFDDDQQ